MTAYLELKLKGNARAFIEAGTIAGVVTGKNMDIHSLAHEGAPVSVILRGGETIDVIETSAGLIIARALLARQKVREQGLDILVDYLGDQHDDAGRPAAAPLQE